MSNAFEPTSRTKQPPGTMMSRCLILLFASLLCQSASGQAAIDLSGELVLVLLNVSNVMAPHVIPHYEQDLESFFGTYFSNSSAWPGEITNWNVRLDEQQVLFLEDPNSNRLRSRKLGAQLVPLETRCFVTAEATQTLGQDNFARLLQTTLDEQEQEFLTILKESESVVVQVQFKYVNATQTFRPNEVVTTPRVVPNYDTIAGALKPPDVVLGIEDTGLSGGEIAGIVIACLVFICLICGMFYIKHRKRHHQEQEDEFFEQTMSPRTYGESMRYSTSKAAGSQSRALGGSVAGSSMRTSVTDRYKSQRLGALRSSSTRKVSPEGKTVSTSQGSSIRTSGNFPLMKLTGDDAEKARLYASSIATDDEEEEEEVYEDEEIETSPQQQQRDVFPNQVYLPHQQQQQQFQEDNISYADESQLDVASFGGQSSTTSGYWNYDTAQSRVVMAPAGRLGMVVETRLAGPIINRINDDSPLLGLVFAGDLILEIDNVDCRAMSAVNITSLMVRTSNNTRRMVVKTPLPQTSY